jgi:hypothetical protein
MRRLAAGVRKVRAAPALFGIWKKSDCNWQCVHVFPSIIPSSEPAGSLCAPECTYITMHHDASPVRSHIILILKRLTVVIASAGAKPAAIRQQAGYKPAPIMGEL